MQYPQFMTDQRELDIVPSLAGIVPAPGVLLPSQDSFNELMEIRSQFPFVSILPVPTHVTSVVCVNANQAYDMQLPDGCVFGKLQSQGDFYISFGASAAIPKAGVDDNSRASRSSLYKPTDFFYAKGHKQWSVISPNAGTIVQFFGWITNNKVKG